MPDAPKNSRLRFTLRALLFLTLCTAGFLAGYRAGHENGYRTGLQKRKSEQPVVIVYNVSDIVSYIVIDPESGRWHLAPPEDRSQANLDFDSLIQLITSTIHPDSWDEVGGPGSVEVYVQDQKLSLVVSQYPYVQEEIESLLSVLRDDKQSVTTENANTNQSDDTQGTAD